MTNFEHIKEMVENHEKADLAKWLCNLFSEAPCRECPATNECYPGHNGMREYLDNEMGASYEYRKKYNEYKAKRMALEKLQKQHEKENRDGVEGQLSIFDVFPSCC